MRILHVIPAVAARYGGPSAVALQTCRALAERGHTVLLAATDADGPARLAVPTGSMTIYQDVDAVFFPRTRHEGFKWSPALASWLDGAVGAFDLVDVHAVFSHSSLAAGRACRAAGVPYVVRPHGTLDPWSLGRKSAQKQVLFWLGARRLLTRAARVQYTTPEEQRLAAQALPWLSRGVVVPLGVPESCFTEAPATPADPPYVLVLSRLEAKKGLELLVDAFQEAALSDRVSDWRLVIAGDGDRDYVQALRHRANAGPARDRIRFAGWVEGEEKAALLRGASLFASPSEQENFGLSAVEAMAAGVPVIVARGVNLAPEIAAAGAGWIVDRGQRTTVPRVLESVLQDRSARATRGRAAWNLARRFRWDTSVTTLIALYEQVVRERARGGGVAA
jgi:glycosyltransferase involved in cell wall biosynthesis